MEEWGGIMMIKKRGIKDLDDKVVVVERIARREGAHGELAFV